MLDDPLRLLIRGTNWIGDAVITIPAIHAVREAYPEAHISLLVKPWVSDIFKGNPDIDEIILYEKSHESITGKFRLAGMLRKMKFDMAILLQNAFDAALITRLAGIRSRMGYKRDGRGFLLTNAVPVKEAIQPEHQGYYYLNLLDSVGIKTENPQPFIYLTDTERQRARDILRSHFPGESFSLIGINPGATYGSAKSWPAERFAEVITRILNELHGSVVIFGSESEKRPFDPQTGLCQEVRLPRSGRLLSQRGQGCQTRSCRNDLPHEKGAGLDARGQASGAGYFRVQADARLGKHPTHG